MRDIPAPRLGAGLFVVREGWLAVSLSGLLDAVAEDQGVAALLEAGATAGRTSFDLAAPRSVRPFAL
ncbi:MAG: hypothetical protein HOV83_18320, partial [Catenulispora sp.]|nr:hypothetical protein [Catenulispora sp.]